MKDIYFNRWPQEIVDLEKNVDNLTHLSLAWYRCGIAADNCKNIFQWFFVIILILLCI